MGGGGGGGFSGTINVEEVRAAANRRIKDAMGDEEAVLFVAPDRLHGEINDRIGRTENLSNLRYDVCSLREAAIREKLSNNSLIVMYIGDDYENAEMGTAANLLTEAQKTLISTQKQGGSFIPTFVQVYRIRILSWSELVDIIGKNRN